MNKFLLVISLTLLSATLDAAVLVTDVVGKARMSSTSPINALATINDGRELALSEGARLSAVDLVTGTEYVLYGPGIFVVESTGLRASKGGRVEARPQSVKLPGIKALAGRMSQATVVMRDIPRADAPVPLSPVRTVVVDTPPRLSWTLVDGVTDYRITVSDELGRVVFRETTSTTELVLPANATAGGKRYVWRVEAIANGSTTPDASSSFRVASDQEVHDISAARVAAGEDHGRLVLLALQLEELGAVQEAKRLWRALAKERPDDAELRKLSK